MTILRHRQLAALVAVIFAASGVRAAEPDGAAAPDRARTLFERGRALLEEDRPEEACAAFAESHALVPTIATLLNLGVCHRNSGRLATALDYFRRAKEASSASGDATRAAKAAQDEEQVAELVGTLTLRAEPPLASDLEVWMDGEHLPRAAWSQAMPLDAGDHHVEVRSGTRTVWSARLPVANGVPSVCDIPKLAAKPEQAPPRAVLPPPAPKPAHDASPRIPVASYVAGGVGLASFGVGLVFGLVAWGKYSKAEDECPNHACNNPHVQELYASAERSATAANVAAVIGAVSFGTGIVLYFTQGRREEKQVPAVGLVTMPVPQGAAAALRGEF